ncbi:MAG: VIT domain-containing protein, partial [Planctomycetota bacterium]
MKARALTCLSLVLAMSLPALAQELIPEPPRMPPERWPPQRRLQPFELKSQKADVTVRDQVAKVTLEPVFHNPNRWQIEGIFMMHLPAGAQVQDLQMTVNGTEFKAELLDSDKARTIYNNIVRQRRDPALLELVGHQLIRVRVFPIAPNG